MEENKQIDELLSNFIEMKTNIIISEYEESNLLKKIKKITNLDLVVLPKSMNEKEKLEKTHIYKPDMVVLNIEENVSSYLSLILTGYTVLATAKEKISEKSLEKLFNNNNSIDIDSSKKYISETLVLNLKNDDINFIQKIKIDTRNNLYLNPFKLEEVNLNMESNNFRILKF